MVACELAMFNEAVQFRLDALSYGVTDGGVSGLRVCLKHIRSQFDSDLSGLNCGVTISEHIFMVVS